MELAQKSEMLFDESSFSSFGANTFCQGRMQKPAWFFAIALKSISCKGIKEKSFPQKAKVLRNEIFRWCYTNMLLTLLKQ